MLAWSLPRSWAWPIPTREFDSSKYQSLSARVFWKTVPLVFGRMAISAELMCAM